MRRHARSKSAARPFRFDGAGAFIPGATGASSDHLGAGTRQINALITDAALWGEEGRHLQYKLTLRP